MSIKGLGMLCFLLTVAFLHAQEDCRIREMRNHHAEVECKNLSSSAYTVNAHGDSFDETQGLDSDGKAEFEAEASTLKTLTLTSKEGKIVSFKVTAKPMMHRGPMPVLEKVN